MELNFEEVVESVRVVDGDRNYWFVRTYSGELYEDFLKRNYVGLGLNNVPMRYIKEGTENKSAYLQLKTFIENNTDYKKGEATKWTNQLLSFEHDIKVGDIVMIPSKNSDILSFGIVESDVIVKEDKGTFLFKNKYEPYPEKRRKIKWIKDSSKSELGTELRGLISSHQGLTNAGWYSQFIEGNLSTIYIKEDKVYLSLKVNQDEEINAFQLSRFLDSLTFFYKEFCDEFDEEFDENLFIKIKLQSKGKMLFNGACKVAGIALLGMLVMSKGANFEADLFIFKLKASTGDGFLKTLSDFKDSNAERKQKYANLVESKQELKVNEADTTDADSINIVDSTKKLTDTTSKKLK